jgi:hypothetical protein
MRKVEITMEPHDHEAYQAILSQRLEPVVKSLRSRRPIFGEKILYLRWAAS